MGPSAIYRIDGWLLVVGSLVLFAILAVVTRLVGERVVTPERRPRVIAVVSPLTPALAALFAVLVAFTVVTEAGYLRTSQGLASDEAAAASRLAWASTNPGVDRTAIQDSLERYLEARIAEDWDETFETSPTQAGFEQVRQHLERSVRTRATEAGLPSAVTSELLTSVDGLTTARRQLLAEASRTIPLGYLILLVVAGIALVVNVVVLSLAAGRRGAWLPVGVVAVVALSLALLVGISAPFTGPLTVDHDALSRVLVDLRGGVFTL